MGVFNYIKRGNYCLDRRYVHTGEATGFQPEGGEIFRNDFQELGTNLKKKGTKLKKKRNKTHKELQAQCF